MPATSHELTPEQETKLRIKFGTEYEFAIQHSSHEMGDGLNRDQIRDILMSCSPYERRLLEVRVRRRLRRADELMDGNIKIYDGPKVRVSDLQSGVRLAGDAV